jgi:hypothetical protein
MIKTDKEIYSSPYYFFLKEKGNDYSLYFSVENTLTEARKKDKMLKIPKDKLELIKKYINKVINSKKKKSSSEVEGEIDELVSLDGALMNSKIPILDPMVHPTKTMDQTVVATRITNDPITRGYRTYYGESVEEEMKEEDMSGAFGYEETKDLDGKETYEYFKDELELEPDDAKDRTEQQGKDYTGKKDKSSEFYDDPNFIMKGTIAEIQRQKAIKMLEDMLAKKKSTDSADIGKKETGEEVELPSLVKKNLKSLIKQAEKQGVSRKDLIKLIQSE